MINKKIELGARVKFIDKPFLPGGFIKKHVFGLGGELVGYIVKLDKKAPNQYAYNTDEIFDFPASLQEDVDPLEEVKAARVEAEQALNNWLADEGYNVQD